MPPPSKPDAGRWRTTHSTLIARFIRRAIEVLRPITLDDHHDHPDSDDPNADLKSPISLIHEIALKRSLTVEFKILSEKGPPHMKTFVTQCVVGSITVRPRHR